MQVMCQLLSKCSTALLCFSLFPCLEIKGPILFKSHYIITILTVICFCPVCELYRNKKQNKNTFLKVCAKTLSSGALCDVTKGNHTISYLPG